MITYTYYIIIRQYIITRYNTIREVVKQYKLNPRRVIKYLSGHYPDTEKLRIVYE